jgi:molybdopterin molybdotransferase
MSELAVNHLLSVSQAIAILDAVPLQPRIDSIPLMEAVGLRLAEDIFSDRDYPPFHKAVMDGYAVLAGDVAVAGARFSIIETIAAGHVGNRSVQPGQAAKIMTGAPVPCGADAVVPIEWTTRDGGAVVVNRAVKHGNAIANRGSDTPANQLLLAKGTRLGPAQIAVAASVGKGIISVYQPPTVSLLSTGDEIIDFDQVPTVSQIRNSNGPMLTALLRRLGCRVKDLGIVRDDPGKIEAAIKGGLQSNALFITGGMSMGDHDYVPMLLRELGLDLKISKLRIKPGKPFIFATGQHTDGNRQMVFGLPGNPVSAYVCTFRLAARILARLAGGSPDAINTQCKLGTNLPDNGPRELYLPAIESGGQVQPLSPNGSADLFTLAHANALIILPENSPALNAGTAVAILKLDC